MKLQHNLMIGLTALALAACSLTPEQQEAKRQRQIKASQDLSVALARQCDPEAADLLYQQYNPPLNQSDKEKAAFQQKLTQRLEAPVFKACYDLAWKSYKAQEELEQMRYQYYEDWRFRPYFCYLCW
ncbi:hypothetical protein A4G20_04275 [Pasteurellaceae bacterium RH1A]|nr:hypothetical protein A4G20_04275 [Pasteurellaceae bacterium RH1A]